MARKKRKTVKKNLHKYGEMFLGNHVNVKIHENESPEHNQDNYRCNVRIVIDYKQGRHKVMPTLSLYDASDPELEMAEKQLISAAISIRNARHKLADYNGKDTLDLSSLLDGD